MLHVNLVVAIIGHAYLGTNILEVSLSETSRVAAQLHLRILIAMVLVFAFTSTTKQHEYYHHHSDSYFHPLLQRRIIIKQFLPSLLSSPAPFPLSSPPFSSRITLEARLTVLSKRYNYRLATDRI